MLAISLVFHLLQHSEGISKCTMGSHDMGRNKTGIAVAGLPHLFAGCLQPARRLSVARMSAGSLRSHTAVQPPCVKRIHMAMSKHNAIREVNRTLLYGICPSSTARAIYSSRPPTLNHLVTTTMLFAYGFDLKDYRIRNRLPLGLELCGFIHKTFT